MNEPEKTPDMEITHTRKTVKLNVPSAAAKPAADFEETHTRKTVKLKPAAQSSNTSSRPIQPVIASPLHNRDTDTGNLSIMSDTQTRRTVKLKPLTAAPKPPVQVAGGAPEAKRPTVVLPPAEGAGNDITRKVTPVKPAAAGSPIRQPMVPQPEDAGNDITRKVAAVKPAAAQPAAAPEASKRPTVVLPPAEDSGNDITRKVAAVKPAAAQPAAQPAAPVSPSKQTMVLPTDDATRSIPAVASKQTMVLPPEEEESPTVKISRPLRPSAKIPAPPALSSAANAKPAAPTLAPRPPAPGLAPHPGTASAAPASGAAPAPTPGAPGIPTLKKKDPSAASNSEAEMPHPKLELKKKTAPENAAGGPPILDDIQENDGEEEATSSVFFTAAAAVALILLLVSAGLSAVSYLNLYEGMSISLPGISATK